MAEPESTSEQEGTGEQRDVNKENVLATGILGILGPAVRQVDEKVGDVR